MGLSLWQINDKIEQIIIEGTDHETGEISEEALAELEAMEITREEKAINWGLYIKGERAEGDAVQRQADALTARAKGHKARAERLRGQLERLLSVGETFRDARVIVKWRKSTAVDVDPGMLGPKWKRIPPIPDAVPDKVKIKAALKAGEEVIGARMKHRKKLVVD